MHVGAAQNAWTGFAKTAKTEGTTFFIFPGGKLNGRTDSEYLRNSVYDLANKENLDGLISWSSTIVDSEPADEFEHFHKSLDPLPYLTISCKIPGHPCVKSDSYNGMKSLVTHFIDVHQAKKIAFIRGPKFHQPAEDRFMGYYDALKEAGLETDKKIITDPFDWNMGEEAAMELYERRNLVPGRDFDTLIGSSDFIIFGAVNYFKKKGYHVPADYRVGGFNNSGEGRIFKSSLSTVHMPYAELSTTAFKIMLKMLNRKKDGVINDVTLPSKVIIRESCGCRRSFTKKAAETKHTDEETTVSAILRMATETLKLNPLPVKVFLDPIIRAFFNGKKERFFYLLEKAIERFLNAGYETESLVGLIEEIFYSGLIPEKDVLWASSLIYNTVFRTQEWLSSKTSYETEKCNSTLNSLKCELLRTKDRGSLVQSLSRYLPDIGITTGAIVLYEDDKLSLWVGSFSPQGISPLKEQRFPSKLLVLDQVKSQYADGIFMVQPLFIENQSLGYFIHNVPFYNGLVFEELRSTVSYALKGIALMNEAIRAKTIAEQAERAKTDFLRLLENELYNPLAGIMEKIEALEKNLPAGNAQDILDLKSFIASRNNEAACLIDLTLSRIDQLSINKRLFDIEELLPGIGSFPLLTGDASRLSQCFSLIKDVYSGDFSAALHYTGLQIKFNAVQVYKGKKQHLLLAERIVLLHSGSCVWDSKVCTITLPWTTLTGREPVSHAGNIQDIVLALSDPSLLPANFFDNLKFVQDIELAASFPGRIAFVFWDTNTASAKDLVRVSALRRRQEFLSVPFLCYGKGLLPSSPSEKTLIDAVEQAIKSPKTGILLFAGISEDLRKTWASQGLGGSDGIFIPSMAEFDDTVSEAVPAMIVLNGLSIENLELIRRNPITVTVPTLIISNQIRSTAEVLSLCRYSRCLLCHTSVASSKEFINRVKALLRGDDILPPHTGALVKKTLLYFDNHVGSHISRWKLAESVHVSEDYLTRIFHREMGLSLWDYLNRYRIFFAADLLRQSDETIQEISLRTGFQDQAYFCRVFKKIWGLPPGKLRKSP